MTMITFPVPAIKFGKSDAQLLVDAVALAICNHNKLFEPEEVLDLEAIELALEEFLA